MSHLLFNNFTWMFHVFYFLFCDLSQDSSVYVRYVSVWMRTHWNNCYAIKVFFSKEDLLSLFFGEKQPLWQRHNANNLVETEIYKHWVFSLILVCARRAAQKRQMVSLTKYHVQTIHKSFGILRPTFFYSQK